MKKLLPLFIFIITAFQLSAQDKAILFDFDYAVYAGPDSTTSVLEVYYALYQDAFEPVGEPGRRVIEGNLHIEIQQAGVDSMLLDKSYGFAFDVDTTLSNNSLLGTLQYVLNDGDYTLDVMVNDKHTETIKDSASIDFAVNAIPADQFSVSDIELANSIRESGNSQSVFYKNTYEVVPNPSAFFGFNVPVVFFYAELYNLDLKEDPEFLKVQHTMVNANNDVKYSREKYVSRKNNAVVEAGAINISKYPSGRYTLLLSVTDTLHNIQAVSSKNIYVYNPNVKDTIKAAGNMNYLASEYAQMSEEQVEMYFGASKYIATNDEVDRWDNISELEGKRKFLYHFWKSRDSMPETKKNEDEIEYFRRIDLANERYGSFRRPGWQSDRGRVLIIYGEPSTIDRYPNETDTKPYEVWRYDGLEGGVVFVFADLMGFNDYTFLHSTMRGELRDDNWRRRINSY